MDSPRTGAASVGAGGLSGTAGVVTRSAEIVGAAGGAGGWAGAGASVVGARAATCGGAGSFFAGGGLGGGGAMEIEGVLTRARSGPVRGGGGGGKVAVAETGDDRTARVSTSGAGPLGWRLVLDASIHALSLAISSSSKLASAEPLPGMPALLQNSTSSLLSIFKSFASA